MALDACVRTILCGLGNPVLTAINGIVAAQIAQVDAEIVQVEASLALIGIAVAPIQALQGLAETVVGEARALANLIPLQLLTGCADLGNAMVTVNGVLQTPLAAANTYLARANRFLSFQDQQQALLTELQASRTYLLELQTAIQQALAGICP